MTPLIITLHMYYVKLAGYKTGTYVHGEKYGWTGATGRIWTNVCKGIEAHFEECKILWLKNSDSCRHVEDVVIKCFV